MCNDISACQLVLLLEIVIEKGQEISGGENLVCKSYLYV